MLSNNIIILLLICLVSLSIIQCKFDQPKKAIEYDEAQFELDTPSLKDTLKLKNTAELKPVIEKPIEPKPVETKKAITPTIQAKKKVKAKKKKYKSKIEFDSLSYDFGEITEGDTIEASFKFKNTGKGVLEILSTDVTCGCTQPSYPFIGLEYGDTGVIGVRYISIGKSGKQEATVTIKTNGYNSTTELLITGFVKDRAKEVKKDSIE